MTYSLRRTRDGAGDSGTMSSAVFFNENGKAERTENSHPFVGAVMIVGSMAARSYSQQDYWITTRITEILETRETPEGKYVRFKTGNSEYEWEAF